MRHEQDGRQGGGGSDRAIHILSISVGRDPHDTGTGKGWERPSYPYPYISSGLRRGQSCSSCARREHGGSSVCGVSPVQQQRCCCIFAGQPLQRGCVQAHADRLLDHASPGRSNDWHSAIACNVHGAGCQGGIGEDCKWYSSLCLAPLRTPKTSCKE